MYSLEEVKAYVMQEDVKFIRLAFCDILGRQKNISIMPQELDRAFSGGVCFDASAVYGLPREKSDLVLQPDPSTLTILPWRPHTGKVARMFCDITYSDGTAFEYNGRNLLKTAVAEAQQMGFTFHFGTEFEFYLFNLDEHGMPTKIPYDNAGYMDVYPLDRGENVRREICLTLYDMGVMPESSHHEEGPSQHEVAFKYTTPLIAADNAVTAKSVIETVASRNGLYADFSPKPLTYESGSGLHINLSIVSADEKDHTDNMIAGLLAHIKELTLFLNSTENSYERLGKKKAPEYIAWAPESRTPLIRIPAAGGIYKRIELRSPDATLNPYIAYALIIYAALDGIKKNMSAGNPIQGNACTDIQRLPQSLEEARTAAENSMFLKNLLPPDFIHFYH